MRNYRAALHCYVIKLLHPVGNDSITERLPWSISIMLYHFEITWALAEKNDSIVDSFCEKIHHGGEEQGEIK